MTFLNFAALMELRPEDHYVDDNGLMVFTETWHLKRGYCCGNKCRHCPFGHSNVGSTNAANS